MSVVVLLFLWWLTGALLFLALTLAFARALTAVDLLLTLPAGCTGPLLLIVWFYARGDGRIWRWLDRTEIFRVEKRMGKQSLFQKLGFWKGLALIFLTLLLFALFLLTISGCSTGRAPPTPFGKPSYGGELADKRYERYRQAEREIEREMEEALR